MVAVTGGMRAPFPRYWLAGFLSDFGDGVRLAAFPLLAVHYTRSPTAVAAITAVQGLPWLLLGAGAGVIVDRTDRRRVMTAMSAVQAVMMAALVVAILAHGAGLWLIYLAALVTGIAAGLRGTAASASVPRLVKPGDLDQANGRIIAGRIVGSELAGPAAGGLLFGLAAVLPFAVNAGTLGIAVLLLLTLPAVFQPVPRDPAPDPGGAPGPAPRTPSLRHDLAEGVRWLRGHRDVRDLTIAVGVISAMDAAWFAVLVLFVVRVLRQQPGAYGVLLAIGAVGGVVTGATGARLTRRTGPWPALLIAGLTMAVTQAVLGLTSSVAVAAAAQLASSGAFALFNMTATTMQQRLVPAALLGRVSSLYGTVGRGAEALGALGGGALAALAGIRAPMLAGAVPIAGVSILLAWRHRGSGPGSAPLNISASRHTATGG